ncbi:MAG: MGMT family protein [Pyrobaculum sp.]
MFCAKYGPVTLGWDYSSITIKPVCSRWVSLEDFIDLIDFNYVDKRLIWLLSIPRGFITTYKALGEVLDMSPRAVGVLLRNNPLYVILPCHRVVKSDLSLGGYRWGVEIKEKLLKFEGALCGAKPCRVTKPVSVADVKSALLKSLGIDKN